MPDATDSFDEPPHAFDEMKLPFIFVPHGAPEPTEWLERHRDYIKLPATFVPHARSDRRSDLSSGGPPRGQRPTADGLAAPSDPTAPRPPTGDAMSAASNQTSDHALTSDDPIAAFRRANDALATAASDHALHYGQGHAGSATGGVSLVDDPIPQAPLTPPSGQAPPPAGSPPAPPPPMNDSDTWRGELRPFLQPGFVPRTNDAIEFDTDGLIHDPTREKMPPELGRPQPTDIDT
jgi:hypothetical protein